MGEATFGNHAFANCNNLTTVDFSDAIVFGDYAFAYCPNLIEVVLPSVTSFGDYAFGDCISLTTTNLSSVTIFGSYAFAHCDTLLNIILPLATTFGDSAFYECKALTTVSLPLATTFGDSAFKECKNLSKVTLPSAISFGTRAFFLCDHLEAIDLPVATSFGHDAFTGCGSLIKVNLPSAISFGNSPFNSCYSLTNITLPSATTFGPGAFYACSSLIEVNLPQATTLGEEMYAHVPGSVIMKLGSTIPETHPGSFFSYDPESKEAIVKVPLAKIEAYDLNDGIEDGKWFGWTIEALTSYGVYYYEGDHGTIEGAGCGSITEFVIEGQTPQNVPTPIPDEGYTFIGWSEILPESTKQFLYTSEDLSEMIITSERLFLAMYAIEIIPYDSYIVEFESNGGSSVPNQMLNSGDCVIEPNVPTRDGYIFNGWYSDIERTILWNFDTPVENSMVLYADWIADKSEAEITSMVPTDSGSSAITISSSAIKISTSSNPKTGISESAVYITNSKNMFDIIPFIAVILLTIIIEIVFRIKKYYQV
jgi:uncharacterized repeat protein (TIGR02543 family)